MRSISKDEVIVKIPKEGEEYFSTYAEGFFLQESFEENEVHIHLDRNKVVILYYVFGKNSPDGNNELRRLFVCSDCKHFGGHFESSFPNVAGDLSLFFSLSGRAFDKFKRRMDFYSASSKGEVYNLPLLFFWKLAILCRSNKDNRFTIFDLWKQFSSKKLEDVDWKKWNEIKKQTYRRKSNGIKK